MFAIGFVIGFLSGITTLIVLLKLFTNTPSISISKTDKQENKNQVIVLDDNHENKIYNNSRSDF